MSKEPSISSDEGERGSFLDTLDKRLSRPGSGGDLLDPNAEVNTLFEGERAKGSDIMIDILRKRMGDEWIIQNFDFVTDMFSDVFIDQGTEGAGKVMLPAVEEQGI